MSKNPKQTKAQNKVHFIDLFCGAGGVSSGIHQAGQNVIACVNHDANAILSHAANFPSVMHFTEDIRTLELSPIKNKVEDIRANCPNDTVALWASVECFVAGTQILTAKGMKPIEEVQVGDMVYTHKGRYMPVTETMQKQAATVKVKFVGNQPIETTAEHPFYVQTEEDKSFIAARELKKGYKCLTPDIFPELPIPPLNNGMEFNCDFWWLVGRYLADGYLIFPKSGNIRIVIVCGRHKAEIFESHIANLLPEGNRKERNQQQNKINFSKYERKETQTDTYHATNNILGKWLLDNFGRFSGGKNIPAFCFGMKREWRTALLDGYFSGDGHKYKDFMVISTINTKLVYGLKMLCNSLGFHSRVNVDNRTHTTVNGRTIEAKPKYTVHFRKQSNPKMIRTANFQSYRETEEVKTVYNFSVLEDESYVANGMIVHNCTNFSKAKGGKTRDADSRTLAEHLCRYVETLAPDYIYIENVPEFMCWGPLVAKVETIKTPYGKVEVCPIKYDKKLKAMQPIWVPENKTCGIDYLAWVESMKKFGYNFDFRILNCADYGDPTRRLRYFGIFAKNGLPIKFPAATHGNPTKNTKVASLFDIQMQPWRPVKDCIDFSDMGESIFSPNRGKPLVENTLRRIYAGIIKFVMKNSKEWQELVEVVLKSTVKALNNTNAIGIPFLQGEKQKQAFLTKYMSNSPITGISVPQSIENPCPTVTTQGRLALVQVEGMDFLASAYKSPNLGADLSKVHSLDSPCPTVTTVPHQSIVFLDKYYGKSVAASVDLPANTVTTVDTLRLVDCEMLDNGTDNLHAHVALYKSDSPYTMRIKVSMALLGIGDIKTRMLKVEELKLIQSFPKDYILVGTKREQKKFIGNSVPTQIVKALVEELSSSIN